MNFAAVEEDLYRAAIPTEINLPFLQQLNLKTVVLLENKGSEEIDPMVSFFFHDNNVEVVRIGEESRAPQDQGGQPIKGKSWQPMSEEVVLRAMQEMVNSTKYPLMVIDIFGKHRTGVLMACVRKLRRWSLASIFEEYRRYASGKRRLQNEQFIELFDVDLVHIPGNAPAFLQPLSQQQAPVGAGALDR